MLAALALTAAAPRVEAANDPSLVWRSIETKHFRITYYVGEEAVALRVADTAEAVHARLSPVVGWAPTERTEIVLTDQTESANGSATPLPFNTVRLYVTAPDDLSPLADVDDWYLELVTHEYTHILHTDQIRGLPALLNALVGKTYAPNMAQPRWLLEGLSVFEETERTSGGRLRSSLWNMYMRADVLEGNVAPLDVFSNSARRWPQGNLWYLYGSFFMRWIAETYGEAAIRKMVSEYGSWIVAYGINRSIRRATGRTFEELFPAWIDTLKREYGAQIDAVRARGLREGTRITQHGQGAQFPRFVPSNVWPDRGETLLYTRDDGRSPQGLYRLTAVRDATGNLRVAHADDAPAIRTTSVSNPSFFPDGRVLYVSAGVSKGIFLHGELYEHDQGKESPTGLEPVHRRLTHGARVMGSDVSPDGRQIAFVTNHRGTTTLKLGTVEDGELRGVHPLVRGELFDQAYTPRFSPDGKLVVYSAWAPGGYRDVRIVDVERGTVRNLTHDRAQDGGPCFSPDGRYVYFHSDRTGIANIYAHELRTDKLWQVTNVRSGALQPAISSDGKTLVYVGYTHQGFDLFALPIDPSRWLDAPDYVDPHPQPLARPPKTELAMVPYNPLHTLYPRTFALQYLPGYFGQTAVIAVGGQDITGQHAVTAVLRTEIEKPELQPDVSYTYGRLPFNAGARAYRLLTPRAYAVGGSGSVPWVQETTAIATGIDIPRPAPFDGQSLSFDYSFARVGGDIPRAGHLDPFETPQFPHLGVLGALDVGWSYSNAQRYLWSIGPERGFSVGTSVSLTDGALASSFSGYAASIDVTTYHPMPWLRHHTLALHGGTGTSGGDIPGRGAFFLGGFTDIPIVDTVRNLFVQGGVALRGYPPASIYGRNYALVNAEYRFPIANVDRGVSTFPIFFNRVTGAAFFDYGTAFDVAEEARFKAGAGAELWFDFQIGFFIPFTFRAGYARGLMSEGIDKTYFVASVPY